VVNLAAGLDTRPYRLDLPESLQWVEADLPAMIEEKKSVLGDARPRCRLRQIPVNLQDSAARGAALRSAVHGADRVLVITEGLLIYLDEAEVSRIAADLAALPEVESWITDLAAPAILKMMQKGLGAMLVNAPMKFAPANGVGFFEALGWRVVEVQSMFHAAARLRRLPLFLRLFALLPEPNPRKLEQARWSGVVWLTRTPR
jgi:methyltransferase (TIGR00027 family)